MMPEKHRKFFSDLSFVYIHMHVQMHPNAHLCSPKPQHPIHTNYYYMQITNLVPGVWVTAQVQI